MHIIIKCHVSYSNVNNRSIVCIRNITVTSSNSLESRQFFTNSLRTQPNWSIFFPKMSFTEWPFKLHSGKSWETRWAKPKLPKTAFIGGTWYKVRRYKDINIFFTIYRSPGPWGRFVTWLDCVTAYLCLSVIIYCLSSASSLGVLSPRYPRKVWEKAGRKHFLSESLLVTSQLTVESRIDRAKNV